MRIHEDDELELQLYVTGMHLVKEHGHTLDEVKKDFQVKEVVDIGVKSKNTDLDMAISSGKCIEEFARVFKRNNPDISIVLGDRVEAFSTATASYLLNIPVAHIAGGEMTNSLVDDDLRHAITKLSHLHFVSTEEYKKRVLQLGEENWRVHNVGALSLENIENIEIPKKEEIYSKYGFDINYPLCLVVYHPLTKISWKMANYEFASIFDALKETAKSTGKLNIAIIYPNTDAGGYLIVDEIKKISNENNLNIKTFANLPHEEYISILANSDVLVGNTSSGIIEAPSLGIPYVCVGDRQKGRVRGNNVVDVRCNMIDIKKGLEKALFDSEFINIVKKKENPYYKPQPSKCIINILKSVNNIEKLINKKFVDIIP
jgi:GDP/UDP-N,N'-diacetylbacillosamine 2-epimerase (hydrolysing)